jgi:hypothetical protein
MSCHARKMTADLGLNCGRDWSSLLYREESREKLKSKAESACSRTVEPTRICQSSFQSIPLAGFSNSLFSSPQGAVVWRLVTENPSRNSRMHQSGCIDPYMKIHRDLARHRIHTSGMESLWGAPDKPTPCLRGLHDRDFDLWDLGTHAAFLSKYSVLRKSLGHCAGPLLARSMMDYVTCDPLGEPFSHLKELAFLLVMANLRKEQSRGYTTERDPSICSVSYGRHICPHRPLFAIQGVPEGLR